MNTPTLSPVSALSVVESSLLTSSLLLSANQKEVIYLQVTESDLKADKNILLTFPYVHEA